MLQGALDGGPRGMGPTTWSKPYWPRGINWTEGL